MISALFWNIRGISRGPNLKRLRKLIKLYSIQLVAICEPKVDLDRINEFRMKLGMDCCVANQWGSLWVFYNSVCTCHILGESEQHLTLNVQMQCLPSMVVLSAIHAKCTAQERNQLWLDLVREKPLDMPWLLMGDFNVIAQVEEKRGGLPVRPEEGGSSLILCPQQEWGMPVLRGLGLHGVIIGKGGLEYGSGLIGFC